MGKVLIIGAGGVSQVTTWKCAMMPELFSEICLASRTKSKCDQIAALLPRPIRTARVDADNVPELVALINDFQPDLVVNLALPYQDLSIMDACLVTGVNYLDTANYEPRDTAKFEYSWQWAYQDRFKDKGIMALLGSGFDPGVTSVMTMYALKHYFDEIHTLDIIDCNAGSHGMPFATNFNPEINIREVTAKGRYWEEGQWVETEPLSVKQEFEMPENLGNLNIYLMYHEELESLAKFVPGLKRARFWMSFSDNYLKHLEVLQNVGMTGIEPIKFQGQQIIPLQFLKALLPDPASLGPKTTGKTCIGVVVEGVKDGQKRKYYIYNICDHQD
ncbi:MAG: saccharopine dehydrogenase family protein, partial [Desulfuromonadaceae bacterium]